jgi:hypothetical protein
MARKPAQIGTFGTHLQNFTRSVDIVDDQTLSETCSLIYEYLHSEWDAATFEVVLNSWVDNVPGLRTSWSSANRGLTTTIKGADNKYTSQLVVSFDTGSPLWIVDPEREPLRTVESFADLPPYRPPTKQNLFTSIIIPMRHPNNRILGVIALESATNLNIAEYDSGELELRADELGVLIDLADLNHVQTQGARDAIGNLRKIRGTVVFPQLAKPQLFLAFSAAADQEVVGVLVEVLEEFENQLRVVQRDQIEDSGTSRRSSLRRSQRRGSACVTSRSHRRMRQICGQPERPFRSRDAARTGRLIRPGAVGLDPDSRGGIAAYACRLRWRAHRGGTPRGRRSSQRGEISREVACTAPEFAEGVA